MSCLCGHFESCENCRPKPDDPAKLKAMKAQDWGRSFAVTIAPDPLIDRIRVIFKKKR
jgi:hypothetical protein